MPPATLVPKFLALLATLLLVGIGLTTYTQPNHGGGAYWALHLLLGRALGDHGPPLPGPTDALPITTVDSAIGPPTQAPEGDTATAAQPPEWLARAVRRDSQAVRAWLGAAVLATATVHGDTVRTTLWRLTLHRSCPFLSRMHAVSVGHRAGEPRIVSLSADCPATDYTD